MSVFILHFLYVRQINLFAYPIHCVFSETRLALASVFGPFGVHLLKLTLDTHPGSLMHYFGLSKTCETHLHVIRNPLNVCDDSFVTVFNGRHGTVADHWGTVKA